MKKKSAPAKKPFKETAAIAGPERDPQAVRLPLSLIKLGKNVRAKYDGIGELAHSIKTHGLLQPQLLEIPTQAFLYCGGCLKIIIIRIVNVS